MGRVKKIVLFFSTERYNPLATFLFRLYLDPKMIGAFHKSKIAISWIMEYFAWHVHAFHVQRQNLNKLTSHLCHVLANWAYSY